MSHDQINRYLRREKLTPSFLWENVKLLIQKSLMQYIDNLGKYYYCPLKKNRLVDDTGGKKIISALTLSIGV
jgi:hypothetical protein